MKREVRERWLQAKAAARRTGLGSGFSVCPCSSCIGGETGTWFMHSSVDFGQRGAVLASMLLDGLACEDLP